jgi:hypothetical protein
MGFFPPAGQTVLFGGYAGVQNNLSDTWVLGPTTAVSAPGISTSASDTKSFTVSWGAVGAPTDYVVQYATRRKNASGDWVNGPWLLWKSVSAATQSGKFTGSPGKTYLFRAKAKYAGGATSDYSEIATSVVPYDDRSSRLTFSPGWTTSTPGGRFLGTLTGATAAGMAMSIETPARAFTLIGDECPSCGQFKVLIDGHLVTTVDTQRNSTATRRALFTKEFSATKKHTLRIVTKGTTGHPKVAIDAVAVER